MSVGEKVRCPAEDRRDGGCWVAEDVPNIAVGQNTAPEPGLSRTQCATQAAPGRTGFRADHFEASVRLTGPGCSQRRESGSGSKDTPAGLSGELHRCLLKLQNHPCPGTPPHHRVNVSAAAPVDDAAVPRTAEEACVL